MRTSYLRCDESASSCAQVFKFIIKTVLEKPALQLEKKIAGCKKAHNISDH